jgi:hypothetical protein
MSIEIIKFLMNAFEILSLIVLGIVIIKAVMDETPKSEKSPLKNYLTYFWVIAIPFDIVNSILKSVMKVTTEAPYYQPYMIRGILSVLLFLFVGYQYLKKKEDAIRLISLSPLAAAFFAIFLAILKEFYPDLNYTSNLLGGGTQYSVWAILLLYSVVFSLYYFLYFGYYKRNYNFKFFKFDSQVVFAFLIVYWMLVIMVQTLKLLGHFNS